MADPRTAAQAVDPALREAIDMCLLCYRTCLRMAFEMCIPMGGKHADPAHLAMMFGCANLCRTTAEFMTIGAKLHNKVCGVCAEICEACALSCSQVGDMDECMEVCRRCADHCRRIAMGTAANQA